MSLPPKYAGVLHFVWQALVSEHPLYRFVNLAVAVELLVRNDSPVSGIRHPRCADPNCRSELTACPSCGKSWNIPATLRERSAFLITNDRMRSDFIRERNIVFHGLKDEIHKHSEDELPSSNESLLVLLRNYLGQSLGLAQVDASVLSPALDFPHIPVVVDYELPNGE